MSRIKLYGKVASLYLRRKIVSPNDIALSYNKVSSTYEAQFLEEMHQFNDDILKSALTYLEKDNDLKVLDLAAGTGYNSCFLKDELSNASFILVDLASKMLEQAKSKIDAEFVNEDMLDFLVKEKAHQYDLIICTWALKYRKIDKVLKECYRLLKNNGKLVCLVNRKDTLPQIRKVYPKLLENNVNKINKLMLDLPNPRTVEQLNKAFKKNNFNILNSFTNEKDFEFTNHQEQVAFVTNTGALAGYDVMLDLHDETIKKELEQLLETVDDKKITHRFVGGIYQKIEGKLNNKPTIMRMFFNKGILHNFLGLHFKFRKAKGYKIKNMIKCGLNAIENDRLVKHENSYLLNSFIPPLNSKSFENIANQVPSEPDFFLNHTKGVRLAPISTYFAITNRCMYNCWHCSASKQMDTDELSFNDISKIIEQLHDLKVGIIGLTGGEPLLRKDLEKIIELSAKDTTVLLFTTGYELTYEKALALKKAGLFGIAISMDSHIAQIHDGLRGYDTAFEQAIEAMKNAKKVGLYTMSQTVCTKELLKDNNLEKLALMLKDINVDEMRILEPLPCGKLDENKDIILNEPEQQRLKNYHLLFNHNLKYPKASVFAYFESKNQFGCGAGCQHSYVDSKGNFGPCDFLEFNYGNLLKEDIHSIWQRMHQEMGVPKCQCYAKSQRENDCLPLFYRLLKGDD